MTDLFIPQFPINKRALVQSILFCGLLFLLLTVGECLATANPAAVYCEAMGYRYSVIKDTNGSDSGICTFPDHSRAGAWNFYRGKEAQRFSYCEKNGFTMESEQIREHGFITEVPVCGTQNRNGTTQRRPMLELMEERNVIQTTEALPKRISPAAILDETVFDKQTSPKTLPQSFDWRNHNGRAYIGAIRDQGGCGSCYSFGAAAAAEGTYNFANNRYNGQAVDFSESFIAWCLGKYGPYSDHFGGCDGADYEYAELTALTQIGVTYESNFPYTETDPGSCTHWNDPMVKFQRWGRLGANNTNAIQQALATYGVLDVAVMTSLSFDNYSGGIFIDGQTSCDDGAYTATNHAVALVGWGTDSNHGIYWILRNSWGQGWGENGYMRIQAHSARVGCAATFLEFPTTSPPVPPPVPTNAPVNFLLLR